MPWVGAGAGLRAASRTGALASAIETPGASRGRSLAEEVARDHPAAALHARGRVERYRLALHGGAGLPADELHRALIDGEDTALALDGPRTLEQGGQVVRRDEGAAVVHHADGQEPEASGPVLHLHRLRPRAPRHADE